MTRALPVAIFVLGALAGCRSQPMPDNFTNESSRQAEQLMSQANALQAQAENSTGAIERAMENETRALFDRREALLNGALDAVNAIEAAPSGVEPARRR